VFLVSNWQGIPMHPGDHPKPTGMLGVKVADILLKFDVYLQCKILQDVVFCMLCFSE
jgi:hypothetical protein